MDSRDFIFVFIVYFECKWPQDLYIRYRNLKESSLFEKEAVFL